ACALVGINSVNDCLVAYGGIVKSFAAKLSDITSVTVLSGVVTNFTMATTGAWKQYTYDLDGTANYNQPGTRNGNRVTFEQAAFIKFKGISAAYVDAANKAKDCCDVVFIHVLANGLRLIQGMEELAATGAPSPTFGNSTRIVPTINTDTTANEARMEYNIGGTSNSVSMTTSLTDAAILAL
ncbi:MAG: hypothetical protein ACRCYO_11570, partial [Bacteroidia bacterium]